MLSISLNILSRQSKNICIHCIDTPPALSSSAWAGTGSPEPQRMEALATCTLEPTFSPTRISPTLNLNGRSTLTGKHPHFRVNGLRITSQSGRLSEKARRLWSTDWMGSKHLCMCEPLLCSPTHIHGPGNLCGLPSGSRTHGRLPHAHIHHSMSTM